MDKNHSTMTNMKGNTYQKLLIMAVLSFISMYILMYSMVNTISNVYNSFNQFYMAGVMTAPMVIFGLLVMRSMYPNRRLNVVLLVVFKIRDMEFK